MLDLVRKHARSWLIKVALFLIVIVFIFWGGYSYKTRQEGQMAQVGDHYISFNDYNQFYQQLLEMYRRQLGNSFSEDLLRQMNLKKQALDLLVDRYVIAKAGQELGLYATPQEIQQKLMEFPAFQTEGKFDQKRYVFVLRQNRLTPENFEQQMGQDLTTQKVEAFVKRRAVVTEEEILTEFRFNYSLIQVAYVLFEPTSFEAQVKNDQKALEDFYQQNQNRYMDPEKRQISYLLFSPDSYLAEVRVSENEISQYYEEHPADYHKEQEVRAGHILFAVKQDAPEDEVARVRAEAEKVLAEAKKNKDFTELARKYSQDPSVKENGGDLGYFTRSRMTPEFSEAAFKMKPGEISDLVRSPFGFHIIKMEDVHPEKTTSLEEARGQIEAKLKGESARDMVHGKARDFADQAYAQKDIRKAAQAMNLPLTGAGTWISQKDSLPEVGGVPSKSLNKLFGLPEKGISDVVEVPRGFLVLQIDASQAPQVIPLEKVKDRVEKDYKVEQARVLAQQKALELLENARKLKSLEEAGKLAKLDIKKSNWFSRNEPDKDLPNLQGDAQNQVFQLVEAQPFTEAPLLVGKSYAVVQLLHRKLPEENPEKDRQAISKRLQEEKQMAIWQTWLADQRTKHKVQVFKEP